MDTLTGSDVIKVWPPDSREAAELVIRTYGEPHEACATQLMWRDVGPWKRIVASREFHQHDFPAPHIDAVESSSTIACRSRHAAHSPSSTAA